MSPDEKTILFFYFSFKLGVIWYRMLPLLHRGGFTRLALIDGNNATEWRAEAVAETREAVWINDVMSCIVRDFTDN